MTHMRSLALKRETVVAGIVSGARGGRAVCVRMCVPAGIERGEPTPLSPVPGRGLWPPVEDTIHSQFSSNCMEA